MIGALVTETIALNRVRKCDHRFKKLNAEEDGCELCLVIVTQEGRERLWYAFKSFHGFEPSFSIVRSE